jgi:hypothetical protein
MPLIRTILIALASLGSTFAADAIPAAKPIPYPLDTCIISGDKLNSMGDGVTVIRDGREIKFCCTGCVKDFDKNPAKYVAKLVEAEKAKAAAPAKP